MGYFLLKFQDFSKIPHTPLLGKRYSIFKNKLLFSRCENSEMAEHIVILNWNTPFKFAMKPKKDKVYSTSPFAKFMCKPERLPLQSTDQLQGHWSFLLNV